MTSKRQAKKGYPLPEVVEPEDTLTFCVTIPNDPAYFEAMRGQLTLLGKWWYWKRDEDRLTDATLAAMVWREKFILEENCGMSIDYEALKLAIQSGMYDAVNDVAKQIVSGRTTGFNVGEDGTVTDPTTPPEDPETPEDDPSTPVDESASARSGGASAVRIGINIIWSYLNTWYVAGVTAEDAAARLKLIYDLNDDNVDGMVGVYYAARAALGAYVTGFANTLDSYFYCKGVNLGILAEWIYELHPTATQSMAALMVQVLTQNQLNVWFEDGAQVPSTDYISYGCVPIDPEIFPMDLAYLATNAYKTGAQIGKNNHRIRIDVSGMVNHPSDGSYQDFFYRVRADGIKEFITTSGTYGTVQFTDTFGNPPQSKVPWKASGIYSVTMETTAAAAYRFRRVIPLIHQAAGSAGFTVTLTDLGEVTN